MFQAQQRLSSGGKLGHSNELVSSDVVAMTSHGKCYTIVSKQCHPYKGWCPHDLHDIPCALEWQQRRLLWSFTAPPVWLQCVCLSASCPRCVYLPLFAGASETCWATASATRTTSGTFRDSQKGLVSRPLTSKF